MLHYNYPLLRNDSFVHCQRQDNGTHALAPHLGKESAVVCVPAGTESKYDKWKPLRICRISARSLVAACLSHKSWPASELTLTNVCCYQNVEELQEVNVPCKVQIFQSLSHIIRPWIACQRQTPPEWLYCSSYYRSSQAHCEFVRYSVAWSDPGQKVRQPPPPITHSLASSKMGSSRKGKSKKTGGRDKDSSKIEEKQRKKPKIMQKQSFTPSRPMPSQPSNNSYFGKISSQFS